MPISLTILQVFCLVDFSFFKFILKNAHFLNILVNFWVLWKNVENFHIPEFFFENFTLTIFINALDPDPDPHQNFRSDPDPDPLQNKADPKPCLTDSSSCTLYTSLKPLQVLRPF